MLEKYLLALIIPVYWLLTACQGYDVKINDKVVYSPTGLLTDFVVDDPALRTCLEQAIVDNSITRHEQLTALNCSHAGIEDLSGIGDFQGLRLLKLSSNSIRNLVDIGRLTALETLDLEDNQVIDPVPLYSIGSLQRVNLAGNKKLQCPRASGFPAAVSVTLPAHCL